MTERPPILVTKHYALLTCAFVVFVIYGSFVPFQMRQLTFEQALEQYRETVSQPPTFQMRSDWAANILLFIPLGFLAGGTVSVERSRPLLMALTIPLMGALSAAVEFGQLWFPARNTNVNDIIAETLGGIFGLGCWAFAGQYFTTRVRGAWSALGPGEWAAKVLPGYILFLVATHGMPFDLSISPTMIWHKFKTGFEPEAHDEATGIPRVAFAPYPHQAGEKILQSAAYFLPVGVLFAGLPHRRWQDPKAPFAPIAAGFLVAAGLEAIQVIVLSCSAYATDVLFGTLCCVSGWWLMLSREKLPAWLPPVAFLGWSLALAIVHWAPFDFDADREGFVWVPFADYFQGNYLGAFNSIINKTIQFAPLGFIAIFACTRPQQKWALALGIAVLAGTLVVTGVEIGQTMLSTRPEWDGHSKLVIKPRPGSISDITLGVLGSLTGALVALPCRSMTKAAPPEPTRQQFLF